MMKKNNTNSKKTKKAHVNAAHSAQSTAAHDNNNQFLEQLNFDETSKQMAALKTLIFDSPETSQTKIQFIKEEIEAGRYEIHCNRIATKMLEFSPVVQEEAEIA